MWLPLHRKVKTRVVAGGRSFVDTCPECRTPARFEQVEITESFGAFFLDLVEDKEHKFRCSACGELFDLRDEPKPAHEVAAERAALEARKAREAEQRRKRAEASANQIEDELAELKKRLGY